MPITKGSIPTKGSTKEGSKSDLSEEDKQILRDAHKNRDNPNHPAHEKHPELPEEHSEAAGWGCDLWSWGKGRE
ncbi:hypothetical protein LTR37_021327 [Vermiconidia calcicola]|uniref:Uncharacterized protein n=1 Tax=Vermiconidia calcicola TaxID=1690605 RepID=A0ACC3M951_9PEZI|nr:hypothetical protein LTR37_021327 [Vermiconidia calcicola]